MELYPISRARSKRFVADYHYAIHSKSFTACHLGLFEETELIGACQLGWGTRPRHTIQLLFPSLDTKDYYEISRLCLLPEMPHNSETQFIRLCLNWLRYNHPERKVIFTWADGLRGKPGYIYQASNFSYGGYIWSEFYTTEDGEVVHPRLLVSRYGGRSRSRTQELGLIKYWGKQFRYIKFLCSHAERKRLLAESPVDWGQQYPKHSDLEWFRQAGEGSRESCQLPMLKGLGQFQEPAPMLELLAQRRISETNLPLR